MKHGLLLINLGTPKSSSVGDVRTYLREFLTDKRVIDLPFLVRSILVYGLILPFRPKQSAHAYQAIWTPKGSPLLVISEQLTTALQKKLGDAFKVVLGMRYGSPSLEHALAKLNDCDSITVLPLYPQYSSAATGSSIAEVLRLLSDVEVFPSLRIIRDFHQHPAYIHAQAERIKGYLGTQDHVLFSYHGLPERQITKSGCATVCTSLCPPISDANSGCYRAQCQQTSALLAQRLNLNADQYSSGFQSRLGKTPWIKPYTDDVLAELAHKGIKKLVIACPSFVTDCLETLEEIGMRGREQWFELGGTEFTLIPCLNDDALWIDALVTIID